MGQRLDVCCIITLCKFRPTAIRVCRRWQRQLACLFRFKSCRDLPLPITIGHITPIRQDLAIAFDIPFQLLQRFDFAAQACPPVKQDTGSP